jgi:hypothetical protein
MNLYLPWEDLAMGTIRAIVHDGRLITDKPLNLPEGTELLIDLDAALTDGETTSPESLKEDISRLKELQSIQMTAEEVQAWENEREKLKLLELAGFIDEQTRLVKEWR